MKEDYEKIWDALREFGRRLTGIPKEDNMQNINGQMVDTDKIEALRGYYDAQLDASEWCDFDAETDESYNLTMEIRKAQYDSMIDNMYNLKQRLTYASRHAKELEEENQTLRNKLVAFEDYILERSYLDGLFDYLKLTGDLTEYENDGFIPDENLPYLDSTLNDLYRIGIERYTLVGFAKLKYAEWKKEELNEDVQADQAQTTED